MKRKPPTIESLFPSKAGRDAADAAIDEMPIEATMPEYIDRWEIAYAKVAKSPHIKEPK